MIAALRGQVLSCSNNQVVLDVSGVGYQVFVTAQTARQMNPGDVVQFFTALVVREDSMTIFGFQDPLELDVFDTLRSVSGVGPKSALAILATLSVAQVQDAVATENDQAFKSVSGIGPKTAKLIVVALAGKFSGSTAIAAQTGAPGALTNVIAALEGLGWSERQAIDAVKTVSAQLGSAATTDAVLKNALALLGASKSVTGS